MEIESLLKILGCFLQDSINRDTLVEKLDYIEDELLKIDDEIKEKKEDKEAALVEEALENIDNIYILLDEGERIEDSEIKYELEKLINLPDTFEEKFNQISEFSLSMSQYAGAGLAESKNINKALPTPSKNINLQGFVASPIARLVKVSDPAVAHQFKVKNMENPPLTQLKGNIPHFIKFSFPDDEKDKSLKDISF